VTVQQVVATGRRKTSTARVFARLGTGNVVVNGLTMPQYFPQKMACMMANESFAIASDSMRSRFDFLLTVKGGGKMGQAGAIRHAVARALSQLDGVFPDQAEDLAKSLRAAGYLTRDARKVERKKPGRRKARKKKQFSKR
jgi:small subunit ribosomal protein S9